ncbi:MAG: STAS domain-containing protein [Oscillospiraceae bacterium]|nr:STAS domain-containing protein [Oscillospiraceae bacterium]
MKVLSSYREGRLTLFFKGELDHHEAAPVLRKITQTMDDYLPRDCVVDMGGLTFMDSSGIALILKICRLMAETGGRAWGGERPEPAAEGHRRLWYRPDGENNHRRGEVIAPPTIPHI